MKKSLPLFLMALFAITFASCKKDSKSDPNPSPGSPHVSLKLDGTQKDFYSVSAVKSNLGVGAYTLTITANSATESVYINLWSGADDFTAGKTYTIDAPSDSTNNK